MKWRFAFIRLPFLITAIFALNVSIPSSWAYESGPLIDLLVKKGILTDKEAEEVRAELALEFAESSAGKLQVASDIAQMKIKTDIRTRYQYESVSKAGSSNRADRSRWRYRLKVGADYAFSTGWSAGIHLETSESADSTNTNFGGYFDKNGDDLFLGQVYIDYHDNKEWADLVNFTIGKKKHPFLIDPAFWDSDTNPEGFTQQLAWRYEGDHWFTLRFGEYIIDEEREDRADSDNDNWLWIGQAEYSRHIGFRSDLRIAPYFLLEDGGLTTSATAEGGNTPTNENGLNYFNNMWVVALPIELTFLINDIPQRAWMTYGMNLKADKAINTPLSPYRLSTADDSETFSRKDRFYNFGYTYGRAKYHKEWQLSLEYRHIEAAALTPNLTNSDFGRNSLNQEGVVVSGAFMISNTVKLGATFMNSQMIDEDWISSASTKGDVRLLQIDLNARF